MWRAFTRLSRSRPVVGMDGTPLPIPFSDIDRYAGRFGPYTPEGFERFVVLIETLDHAFLDRDRQHRKAKPNT